MRIYLNRGVVRGPWGGGNNWTQAMYQEIPNTGHQVLEPGDPSARPDVIYLAGIDSDGTAISANQAIMYQMQISQFGKCKLIARVNENDARKGTTTVDYNWLKLSEYVDGTVFVSQWMHDYFIERGWACAENTVILNGVDQTIYQPQPKLNNGKINIVAHHWSNNRLKGFDVYEQLDAFVGANSDSFTFTYIGRDNGTFKYTNVVRPLFGEKLGAELGKYDVYVSASRFDPGPNHILEALACKLPTYVHVEGGGCVEFAGSDHTFTHWNELKKLLEAKKFENNSAITLLDWNASVAQYVKFAERVYAI